MMKRLLLSLMIALLPVAHAAEEPIAVLGAEFWFMPRNGEAVAAHQGVKAAVKKLIAEPDAYLVLRYPETESGELWGQELQAWLVSLGLVSDRIELQPNAELLEAVELVVVGPDVEVEEAPLSIDVPEQGGDVPALESQAVAPEQGESAVADAMEQSVPEAPQQEAEMVEGAGVDAHEEAQEEVQVEVETE
jgi:hypothetical protein